MASRQTIKPREEMKEKIKSILKTPYSLDKKVFDIEQLIVEFVEWTNQCPFKWSSANKRWINLHSNEVRTTSELFAIFEKEKEKRK